MSNERSHGTPRGTEGAGSGVVGRPSPSVGKQTLTMGLLPSADTSMFVQRKVDAESIAISPEQIHEEAAKGITGPVQQIPYLDLIQRSFGGHDVSGVKAHVGGPAAEAAKRIGAVAYASGNSVAFRDQPDLHTAAHEAAHAVQQRSGVDLQVGIGQRNDRYENNADEVADLVTQGKSAEHLLPQSSASAATPVTQKLQSADFGDFGQATSGTTRNLICDLTSPIVVGAQPLYRLGLHGQELWSSNYRLTYRWIVRDRANDNVVAQSVTSEPSNRIPANAPGRYRVEVTILNRGRPTQSTLSLDQDFVNEDAALATGLTEANTTHSNTMRELVNDFRQYIIDSAAATGANGITALFLASVLYVEVSNRPKAGREDEVGDVDEVLRTLETGGWTLRRLNRSLGVGQIRQSTAAMTTGSTPLIDQDRNDREPARGQIEANYKALPLETKRMIFTQLQWPKSNIAMAANLLSTLKNRPHRYPTLTRSQFVADQNAVGVVATEYNSGGTTTPAANAGPASYGTWAWDQMQGPLMQQFFPNT